MRMTIHDRALKYYVPTTAPNAEGVMVTTWDAGTAFNGDLQPIGRTASRIAEYGFDSTESKGKVLFYDTDTVLHEGYKIEDQTDMATYLVSGDPNLWPQHSEAIMVKWNG